MSDPQAIRGVSYWIFKNEGVSLVTLSTTATTATAVAPSATTTAAAATATATRTIFARTRFVYSDATTLELGEIQALDGLVPSGSHLDKREATGLTGLAIGYHLGLAHFTELAEQLFEIGRRSAEGQVSNIQILAHGHLPLIKIEHANVQGRVKPRQKASPIVQSWSGRRVSSVSKAKTGRTEKQSNRFELAPLAIPSN